MSRIDLFISTDCPSCPKAREVVMAFAAEHPDVEVREWDLATNPGPALGLGIFATPSLLLNGVEILLGVPSKADLLEHFGHVSARPDRHQVGRHRPSPSVGPTATPGAEQEHE